MFFVLVARHDKFSLFQLHAQLTVVVVFITTRPMVF